MTAELGETPDWVRPVCVIVVDKITENVRKALWGSM